MRAAVMRRGEMVVDTVPEPVPGPGEVLVRTLVCGICGSDLHMLKHADRVVAAARRTGQGNDVMDLDRDVVMGHEFCAEVVEFGPECQRTHAAGTRVCAMPMLLRAEGILPIGYANDVPGGYGQYMVLNEMLLLDVPNGLSTDRAGLTEPMAVGWHAVAMARLASEDVPLVIGCGPVGLAVIAALKLHAVGPIVAADFSPGRRRLAEQLGADVVVDPAVASPYASWQQAALKPDAGGLTGPLASLVPQHRPAVLFECVGVPGIIEQICEGAPRHARIVVAGVCMEADRIEPIVGITKELNLQFVFGYTPEEFARSLQHLAEGRIDVDPLITGRVGLDGVAGAFRDLADPERHAKILVEPWR